MAESEVDVTHAYVAILDSVAARGTYHLEASQFRLTVAPERPIAELPAVSSDVLRKLEDRGYEVSEASSPLCEGEVRVSFGPARMESPNAFIIEAELTYVWSGSIGDIEWFRYRVDCASGACAVTERTGIAQEEIGTRPCIRTRGQDEHAADLPMRAHGLL